MKILLIEPYYGGSHRAWADGFHRHSSHHIELLTLPDQFWKWRMQGGAVTLARQFLQRQATPDLILATDMMDVSLFRAITRTDIPIALYFHENQLSYPQNRRQSHGYQYGFINYASALASDVILFNSVFHQQNFYDELTRMLKHFPEYNELHTVGELRQKNQVLPLGIDLKRFDAHRTAKTHTTPIILWNHRWEADKNPRAFFKALYQLAEEDFVFNLVLLGENVRQEPTEFIAARDYFGERILHYGYAENFAEYAQWLWQADYVISTANQDFFGIAVAEAIYCACVPLLANRLNYPHLIPQTHHQQLLFRQGALTGLLRQHLLGNIVIDTAPLQTRIAQYDWATLIQTYDDAVAQWAR